jgi:predicted acyltransferase
MATTSIPESSPAGNRLMSIDALRGFDMFWIICAEGIVSALHEMNKSKPVEFVANQLEHVEWEGFHFEDMIFPLFVFIMGVSTVFSIGKLLEKEGLMGAMGRILKRTGLMLIIALIYSGGCSKPWPDIRLMGVLQRIALCYFFGSMLFCFLKPKAIAAAAVALLLGYWAMMAWIPFPDVRPTPGGDEVIAIEKYTKISQLNMASTNMIKGSYIQGVNLANYLDQKYLPGRKYDGTYDPEGYLSTIPAIASCLLGILAGCLLKRADVPPNRKVLLLVGCGIGSVLLGYMWGTQFPVIKKIWTSSFVLLAGGYSSISLGIFYLVVDVWKMQFWCRPFVWMGMNSITIYLVSNFLGGGGFGKLATRLAGGDVKAYMNNHITPGSGDLLVAVVGMVLAFWFLNFLYRKKIFLRL